MISFYRTPIFADPTWYLVVPSIYSVFEPSAYLLCAIMPTLRHLTRRVARSAGWPSSAGYASYRAEGPSQGISARVRSKLRAGSSVGETSDKRSEGDLEMQRLGEVGSGWSRVEAGRHSGVGDVEQLEGIVCKTDVTMYVETADGPWGKVGGEREGESSLEEKNWAGVREGFGDEVPLRASAKGVSDDVVT